MTLTAASAVRETGSSIQSPATAAFVITSDAAMIHPNPTGRGGCWSSLLLRIQLRRNDTAAVASAPTNADQTPQSAMFSIPCRNVMIAPASAIKNVIPIRFQSFESSLNGLLPMGCGPFLRVILVPAVR